MISPCERPSSSRRERTNAPIRVQSALRSVVVRRLPAACLETLGMRPYVRSRPPRWQGHLALAPAAPMVSLPGLARRAEAPDWGQLALACGYFDQSHLINEVREFAGTTSGG